MILIEHRINTLDQLRAVDVKHGAEIDLRSDPKTKEIYLHHDPFTPGERFEDWLQVYADRKIAGPLILNTKEDGLEKYLVEKCQKKGIENFFFLDTALPTLIKWTLFNGEPRFACRLSAYEPPGALRPFYGKVDWLWVDCFEGKPLNPEILKPLRDKFKICLVSPELQASPLNKDFIALLAPYADAVCTKHAVVWKEQL